MVRFGRLFATADANQPSRIYFSDVGDATVWSGAFDQGGWFDVAPGEDGEILEWIEFRGVLYVFKTYGLYRILGDLPSSFTVQRVEDLKDFLPGTVADVRQGVMYGTRDGIYVLGQARHDEVFKVSETIDTDMRRALDISETCRATYSTELNAYLLTTNNPDYLAPAGHSGRIWVSNLNVRPDVWGVFDPGFPIENIYQGPLLYAASATEVYEYVHTGRGGNPKFKTGYWDFGDQARLKHIQYIQGAINARDNCTVTVTPFYRTEEVDSHAAEFTIGINERNLLRLNKNCESMAIQVEYST